MTLELPFPTSDRVLCQFEGAFNHYEGLPRTDSRDNAAPSKREQAKVGRNDPCPCGSGKKFKKCHGK